MLAVNSRKNALKSFFFVKKKLPPNIFLFSYVKIWGETKYQPHEFPLSGSKAEDIEERRAKVNDYNGQYLSPEPINILYIFSLSTKGRNIPSVRDYSLTVTGSFQDSIFWLPK